MRRREFITLLCGAAAAWPLAARGQQAVRIRRIGIFFNRPENDPVSQIGIAAFVQGLSALGWTIGSNVQIDIRPAIGGAERARAAAKELLGLQPDVLLTQGTASLQAMSRETKSLPIVFVNVSDPVGDGYVASLAHPGGNVTGFSQYEYTIGGKWMGLLKEIAPRTDKVAVVMNAANPASRQHLRTIESVAASFGVTLTSLPVRSAAELQRPLVTFASEVNGGLIVLPGADAAIARESLINFAARYRLPAIYAQRFWTDEGGLMSYGTDFSDQHRRAASYVDRILKGEKPADLPVQNPIKFELVINLKSAKALGLDVPPGLSARADEVIE